MWDFRRFGNIKAVIDDSGVEFTYNELAEEGDRLFQKIGGPALVFCLCKNTAGMVMGYTSFVNHHVVQLMLGANIDRGLLNNLLDIYKPEFIWMPGEMCKDFDFPEIIYDSFGYSLVKTGFDIKYELNKELCLLIPTSGSTGSPKLVRVSYENLRSNAVSGIAFNKFADPRAILNLPMNYAYIIAVLNIHLMIGATVLPTTKSILQKEFWSFFRENNANEMHGVPSTYEILMRLWAGKTDIPRLELMTQSGGKMSYELSEKLAKFAFSNHTRLAVLFGQSEATAILGYLSEEKALKKCGSIGKALPGSEYYLVDESGNRITESGVSGELVFKGPGVALGYAQCGEDLAKGDEFGGILFTGDIAKFDDDGYYYIVGRKKRFLKLYGKRVSLDEVETLLKGRFPDSDFAASGKDDEMHIFSTDVTLSEKITEFISEKTGIFYRAFCVEGIDEIPRNEAGKVLYEKLPKIN